MQEVNIALNNSLISTAAQIKSSRYSYQDENMNKNGEKSVLAFDVDNDNFSWLDKEIDDRNESRKSCNNKPVESSALCNDKYITNESDNLYSLDAFRRELDDITRSLDSNTDFDDIVNVSSPISYFSADNSGTKDNNEKRNRDQCPISPFHLNAVDDSFIRTSTPSNSYNSRFVEKPPRSVTSSRRSEPPTPIQTPVRNRYVQLSNRKQYQKFNSAGKPKKFNDWMQNTRSNNANNNVNPTKSNARNAANEEQKDTSTNYMNTSEANIDVLDSSLNSLPTSSTFTGEQRHRSETLELVQTIESMRTALERQESRIRHLEIENSSLIRELKDMKGMRHHYHHSGSSGLSPPSPPPVVLASKLDDGRGPPFFLSPTRSHSEKEQNTMRHENKKSSLNSVNGSSRFHNVSSSDQNQEFTSSCDKTPNQNRHWSNYQYNNRDQYPSNSLSREETDIDEYQAAVDYLANNKNRFSPGTQFVEELTRVIELQTGHHAPLSLIMDKYFDQTSRVRYDDSSYNRRNSEC